MNLVTLRATTKGNLNNRLQGLYEIFSDISQKLEKKAEGTFVNNWIKFWKNLLIDYKAVVIDVKNDIKEKPLKAISLSAVLTFLGFCAKTNPDINNFRDACIRASNQLILVHPTLQKQISIEYLESAESYYNQKKLKRLNIGVASIIWINYYSDLCHTYQSDCIHVQVKPNQFTHRIFDIGFLNRWWILSYKMDDYDVNY